MCDYLFSVVCVYALAAVLTIIIVVDFHFRHESELPICWTWDLSLGASVCGEDAKHLRLCFQ